MERELREDSEDSLATYYPKGTLIIATTNPEKYWLPENYRLSYTFDIYAIDSIRRVKIFVDAENGVILKEISLADDFDRRAAVDEVEDSHNLSNTKNFCLPATGLVNTCYDGLRFFDISLDILGTSLDNCIRGHGIVTRISYSNANNIHWSNSWAVYNPTATWLSANRNPTTAHWSAQRVWDYYQNVWGRCGANNSGMKIRMIYNNNLLSAGSTYTPNVMQEFFFGKSSIANSNNSYTSVDIVGHEFTHGVVRAELGTTPTFDLEETMPIVESFCDIFGILARRNVRYNRLDYWVRCK